MRSTLHAEMAPASELVESVAALERHRVAWDALAVARGRPYCAPGWVLAWLAAVAPPSALTRACLVHDGPELIGIAPFWTAGADTGRYGLAGERTASPVEPLCAAGREEEVAAAVGDLLGSADPRPLEIELKGVPGDSPWPRLLAEHVPGFSPARVERTRVEALPKVGLEHESMDAWLASRSRNFRQQLRHGQRALDEAGARLRVAGRDELDRDIAALSRLHHSRWRARGGSRAMNERVEAMLRLAGADLGGDRFRLLSLDVRGSSISAHLFVLAGVTRAYWLGGFDDRWAGCRPSLQVLAAAVKEGIAGPETCLELGPGGQDYKYRLADSDAELAWVTLTAGGRC